MFANLAGCGVKGNPVISYNVISNGQIVKNFKAVSTGSAIILNWDFYYKDSKINYITIEKSELGSSGNECKDCPRAFERIGQVSAKDIRQENKEYRNFSFTDNKVINGKMYNYRLLICEDFNICRESSATEINFK